MDNLLDQDVINRLFVPLVQAAVARCSASVLASLMDTLNDHSRVLREQLSSRLSELGTWYQGLPGFVLPDETKYVRVTRQGVVFVLETPPRMRTLFFDENLSQLPKGDRELPAKGKIRPATVAMPYVITTVKCACKLGDNPAHGHTGLYHCGEIHLNYRNHPLRSLDDMLYNTNLPNINDGASKVCLGGSAGTAPVENLDFGPVVQACVAAMWSSSFNADYHGNYLRGVDKDQRLRVDKWPEASRQDPTFVLNVNWDEWCTLRNHLDRILPVQQAADWSTKAAGLMADGLGNAMTEFLAVAREVKITADDCTQEVAKLASEYIRKVAQEAAAQALAYTECYPTKKATW